MDIDIIFRLIQSATMIFLIWQIGSLSNAYCRLAQQYMGLNLYFMQQSIMNIEKIMAQDPVRNEALEELKAKIVTTLHEIKDTIHGEKDK